MKTTATLETTPLFPVSPGFRQAGAQGSVQGFADQLSGLARLMAESAAPLEAQPAAPEETQAETALPPEAAESASTEETALLAEDLAGNQEEDSARQPVDREPAEHEQPEFAELPEEEQPEETELASAAPAPKTLPHQAPEVEGARMPGPVPSPAPMTSAERAAPQAESSRIRTGAPAAMPQVSADSRAPIQAESLARPAGIDPDLRLELGRGRQLDPALMRWLQANGSPAAGPTASAAEPNATVANPALQTAALRPHAASEWAPIRLADQPAQQWGRDLAAALGERLSMQVLQNVKEARVRLDPPELGRIEMTVRLEGDRLNVQLHASQMQVRDLLAQHAERLRLDLIEQHGHSVDVHVGTETGRQDSRPAYPEQERIERSLAVASEEAGANPLRYDSWLSTKA